MSEQKQPEHLVDIYAELKQNGVKEKFYYIGDGEKKEIMQQKIKEKDLENDFILLGQIENPYPFFKNAKLFLHTAKYEGLAGVLIESLAFGVPVVSYDCPTGPRDVLSMSNENTSSVDKKCGILIPLNDKETFVKKTFDLLKNTEEYKKLKKDSIERVKNFEMKKNTNELKKLLEDNKDKE